MLTALQMFLTIVICVAVSVIVFTIILVALFSPGLPILAPFGSPDIPLSESLLRSVVIGAAHGLVTGLLFCWRKPDSIGGSILTTIVGTEIFLIFAVVAFYLSLYFRPTNSRLLVSPYEFEAIYRIAFNTIAYYIIFSAVLLIPSAIMGIINRFALKALFYNN